MASSARLHKRSNSATLSPVADQGGFAFSPKVQSWATSEAQRPTLAAAPSNPLKIRPYLRKLSSKDSNGLEISRPLDLSRPAAENDLAGLGIFSDYGGYSRSIHDISFSPTSRHKHNRSTSNTSQFSTSSGLQRPTPLTSIRQTPQSYTLPVSKSSPPSVRSSENECDDIMSAEESHMRRPARRSDSLSSVPGVSLRIHTNNSTTRLAGSYSQSSVSLSSPVAQSRSRGDTLKSIDTTTSPSSRTSFDQTCRFIRGGRDSPVDAASRAASIRAARLKFEEEERAKERKYEKEAHKQLERDYRKQLRKEDQTTRRSETLDRNEYKRSRSISDTQNEKPPRPSVGGRQYSDHREAHSNSLPKYVTTVDPEKQSGAVPKVTKSRAAKGRWLRFVTWFKTRLLRMSGR
ncbi:Nn.00g072810.m01.CDS01 [Neocucurbitaria sp. VM-36]